MRRLRQPDARARFRYVTIPHVPASTIASETAPPSTAQDDDVVSKMTTTNASLCTAVRKPSSGAPAFVPARAA